eukprot:NODE_26_length_40862_cov_0.679513.p24 type:complete len:168 gc:universal NODE_26_length_40862_cov_0.679513:37724-37221(-)
MIWDHDSSPKNNPFLYCKYEESQFDVKLLLLVYCQDSAKFGIFPFKSALNLGKVTVGGCAFVRYVIFGKFRFSSKSSRRASKTINTIFPLFKIGKSISIPLLLPSMKKKASEKKMAPIHIIKIARYCNIRSLFQENGQRIDHNRLVLIDDLYYIPPRNTLILTQFPT